MRLLSTLLLVVGALPGPAYAQAEVTAETPATESDERADGGGESDDEPSDDAENSAAESGGDDDAVPALPNAEASDGDGTEADDDAESAPEAVGEEVVVEEPEVPEEMRAILEGARSIIREALEEAERPVVIPPANLEEAPSLAAQPLEEIVVGHDEEEGWDAEVSIGTGLWLREGVEAGSFIGASFALVEQGPQTGSPYVMASDYARRALWAIVDAELGLHPGAGTDETEVVAAVHGVRTEVTSVDQSESGYSEIRYGPVRYERAVTMDRELDLTVAVVEGFADRHYRQREGISTHVVADVGALGYKHIRYAPRRGEDHFFNGVRALSVDVLVAPEFALGESGSSVRYLAGVGGDIALGGRDGGLLVVHSDLSARSGLGGDITEWVSWSALIGYRAAVDNRRPNRAGWLSTIRVEGRFP